MASEPNTAGADAAAGDHQAHEHKLAAALRELIREIHDGGGELRDAPALRHAQAVIEDFDLMHEQRSASPEADPAWTPPEYRTWTTGP